MKAVRMLKVWDTFAALDRKKSYDVLAGVWMLWKYHRTGLPFPLWTECSFEVVA